MNNLKQSSISKSRSYISCLSEAHRMLFDNFRLIFGRTWMYFAALALLAALYFSLYTHVLLYGNTTTLSVLISVASLVTLCAEVVYYARIMFLVNGRPMKWNIRRCAVLAGVYVLFWLVVALVYAAVSYGVIQLKQTVNLLELRPMFIAFSCVSMLIGVLLIPYVYSGVKYLVDPESKLKRILLSSYVTGLKHIGLIFIALFLAVLCVVICALFVSIPIIIVLIADAFSVFGVNYFNDPTGLPSYFHIIQYAVFTFTFFIWAYLNVFVVFVCYFLYGSIETREKEKREFIKSEKSEE